MIENFNSKEYSPRVLEIFNSKLSWFIRYGTLFLFMLIAILLYVSSVIKIQNNINVQIVFYADSSNNAVMNNKVKMQKYFISPNPVDKLLQIQRKNGHNIYALMKSHVKISSNFKIGQTILLELPNLSMVKKRFFKCAILSFDDDIFDNNQIVTIGFNSYSKSLDLYLGKKIKAKIIMKDVTIFSKFKSKVKIL